MTLEDNFFVTFPISSTQTVTTGTSRIDFIRGRAILANGSIIPLANRSTQITPLQSIYFNIDKDINVEISLEDNTTYKGLIPAGHYTIKNVKYDLIIITTTSSTEIFIAGSHDKEIINTAISSSAANTTRTTATEVVPIQHIGANGSPMPSGASVTDPIHVSTGGAIATTVGSNRQVVAVPTTPVALAASTAIKEVTVTAETNNTDIVCVGGSNVLATLATRRGTPLYPSDSFTLKADNLAEVYIDALVATEGVTFTYLS